MSNNLPLRHIGRETTADTFFLDESGIDRKETWKFSRWDRSVWVQFAEWAKTVLPDPIKETLKNIDFAVLKDAEVIRKLKLADHDEEKRVRELNRAEIARVEKLNQEEIKNAEHEKRKAVKIEPRLTPFIPMADGYKDNHHQLTSMALNKASSYLQFQSPEMASLLNNIIGGAYLFFLLLRRNHPDMTEDLACEIYMELGEEEVSRIFQTTQGQSSRKRAKNSAGQPA